MIFRKFARHDLRRWALTGGVATEIHHWLRGHRPPPRPRNDIDFVADSFADIPDTLANSFLFRHVHPEDPPGKTLLQLVDPETALRVDVFRTCGDTMRRTSEFGPFRLIAIEDLLARTARLSLDLAEGLPVPAKHARDFERLSRLIEPAEVEAAWQTHRKPAHPSTFAEAGRLLQALIRARGDLLIAPRYSQDPEALCPRCRPIGAFRAADPRAVLSLLGYC